MATFRIIYVGSFGQEWANEEVYLDEQAAKAGIEKIILDKKYSEKRGKLEVFRIEGEGSKS